MSKISDALFSKSTKTILANVFMRPTGVHLRALMQLTGLGSASAQRELGKLTEAGILVKEEAGKVILYKPDTNSPIYAELSSIILKTEGVTYVLQEMLLPFQDRIERAFIYGSVAKSEDTAASDIDLFVLADKVGSADLYPLLVDVEQRLGRKISLAVYRPAEYRRKLEAKNHFLITVMDGPKIELIGNCGE
jgi:predicted nucleotidyltransferase